MQIGKYKYNTVQESHNKSTYLNVINIKENNILFNNINNYISPLFKQYIRDKYKNNIKESYNEYIKTNSNNKIVIII